MLYVKIDDEQEAAVDLERNLKHITPWANKWKVTFNPQKTVNLAFSRKRECNPPQIRMNETPIGNDTRTHKHLRSNSTTQCKMERTHV